MTFNEKVEAIENSPIAKYIRNLIDTDEVSMTVRQVESHIFIEITDETMPQVNERQKRDGYAEDVKLIVYSISQRKLNSLSLGG